MKDSGKQLGADDDGVASLETDLDPLTSAHAGAPDAQAHLFLQVGPSADALILLPGDEIVIGRSGDVHVLVDSPLVSRRHARVRHLGAHLEVEDLGSRNGTRLNGQRIEGRRILRRSDRIEVASASIVVVTTPGQARDAPPRPSPSAGEGEEIVCLTPKMIELFSVVRRLALVPTTVLILGETGVGKEVIAEELHRSGGHASGPCVRVNCAALPEQLAESELFGHEKGAFTGATQRRVGHIEAAHRGTLFLDEVGDLSLATQAKLLRVLETKRLQRVGSTEEILVDVRFVCATHLGLAAAVASGRFRRDLYYRIAGFVLEVPPLRERIIEIAPLALRFVARFARRTGASAPAIHPDAIAALEAASWPGNVRELRNALEHAFVMSGGAEIRAAHLPFARDVEPAPSADASSAPSMRDRIAEIERASIETALAQHGGNQTRAAKHLGISRRTLLYKLARYRASS